MGFCQQLKGMLKLEYILSKRNLFLTFIEIFSPIILLFFFLFISLLFSQEKEEYSSLYKNDLEYIFTHSSNLTNDVSSDYKLENIKKDENASIPYIYFLKQCKNIRHIALIGKNFPQELKQKIISHFWEFDDDKKLNINENDVFKYFENVDEFNKYISSEKYGENENNPEMCFGISVTDEFQFGIHYKTIDFKQENSNEIEELLKTETPHIPDMKSEKDEQIRIKENPKYFEYYKNSGYLMVLKIIYDYFLQKITGDSNSEIQFSIMSMKYDEILINKFHKFLSLLGFFIIISYAIPMSINIYKHIHLKETQKKEYLKTMGLGESVFFITYFFKSLLINIIHTIFNALIVYGVLKQSQYGYLFLIFFFFGLVIFSMTYFFQSFLRVSRLGVIISLLIFCIMSFFYIPMKSPEINKNLRNFVCVIFPPTNLLLGFNAFYTFEKEFNPLNNRIKLDVAEISISLMIAFLIVSFVLYIFLGFIISNCSCFGNGVYYKNENKSDNNDFEYIEENTVSLFNVSDENNEGDEKYKNKNITEKSSSKRENLKKKYKNNPPRKGQNNDLDNLGQNYIDSDNLSDNNDKNKNNKDDFNYIKEQYLEYIDSRAKNQAIDIQNKKLENLKKSLWKIKQNKIDTTDKNNPFFYEENDDLENSLENQIEAQKIKNLRRTVVSNVYNLNTNHDEKKFDPNLKLSNIEFALDESVKESLENIINLIGDKNKSNNNNINDINQDIKQLEKKGKNNIIDDTKQYPNNESSEKKGKKMKKEKENIDIDLTSNKKEDENIGVKICVSGLTMTYEKEGKPVLNGLSFKLKKSEIFALLGQNGEGKSTFVSILSGLRQATSGSITYINDNDKQCEILSSDGLKLIRHILGICNQNNVLIYEDLTVKENLEIFCSFKFNYKIHTRTKVNELLNNFKLKKCGDKKAAKLSGGEKRKLMMAIACCGGSEIIILDEPTGGVDTQGKNEIWEILKEMKKDRVIILITHYMDEAWELADRIGILKDGKLKFCGTQENLIDKYEKYIKLQINKKINKKLRGLPGEIEKRFLKKSEKSQSGANNIISETGSDSANLIGNTESFSSNTTINLEKVEFTEYHERALIKIPKANFNIKKLDELLKLIEEEYDVKNYSVDSESLDDLFINVVETKKDYDKKKYISFSDDYNYNSNNDSCDKFKNELKIMMFKRFYETVRDKTSLILEMLFPILLTFIACLLCYFEIIENNKSKTLDLFTMDQNQQTVFCYAANNSNYEDIRNVLSAEIKSEERKYPNYNFLYIPNVLEKDGDSYVQSVVKYFNVLYEYSKREGIKNSTGGFYFKKADKVNHKYEFSFYINSKKKHSTIYLTNYLLRTIARYELKRSYQYQRYMDNIQITNSPFPLTFKEKNDKKTRNGFSLVFFISIALSLIPANFITIIVREKENKSKHLQKLSGSSIYVYWLNNYIFELAKYYIVLGICLLILFLLNYYEKYLFILYIFYGPALVSFTYVLSYFLNKEGNAQITILLVNLFFGSLCGSAVLILRTNKNLKIFGIVLSFCFRLVPSFCICYGYNQLISKKILYAIDHFKSGDDIDIEKMKKEYNDTSFILKDPNYILWDIIFLVLEIIIYTLLLIFLENKEYLLWKFGLKKIQLNYSFNNINVIDSDNKKAKKEQKNNKGNKNGITSKDNISKRQENIGYALEVYKLSKDYYKKDDNYYHFLNYLKYKLCCCIEKEKRTILNNISFKVSNGECFCLLGRNGSGKTTSFKCFSKEIIPDKGSIIFDGIDIRDFTKEQPMIGYCPQFDCIFEYLTTRENLIFYAKLKNIKEISLNTIIDTLIDKLGLRNHENKIAKNLSGGNKRKLSVGISLLCKPVVILMDEPSTGMDPYSRQQLLDLIHNAYLKSNKKNKNGKKRALVLITHLIEEANLISDTIGILHNKKIKEPGRVGDFIQREANEIILSIEFYKSSNNSLKEKYGDILSQTVKNSEELNNLLSRINKGKYANLMTKDKFGKQIFKVIKKKGYSKSLGILRLVKYLDNITLLSSKIKEYFNAMYCIDFSLNNFIFKVTKVKGSDKCPSRICGILEKYREQCNISEYTYEFNTLGKIFLNYTKDEEDKIDLTDSSNKEKLNKFNISL